MSKYYVIIMISTKFFLVLILLIIVLRRIHVDHVKSGPSFTAPGNNWQQRYCTIATTVAQLTQENSALKQENDLLKQRNKKLLDELTSLKKNTAGNKRKASGDDTTTATSTTSNKKCKTLSQLKQLFEKWQKSLSRESAKHRIKGCSYEAIAKETTPWSRQQFLEMFEDKGGIQIQPPVENKPTSTITILRFDLAACKALFQASGVELAETGYTAQYWRSRNVQKSFKWGDVSSELTGLDVHYNKSKQSLQLHFQLKTEDYYW